MSEIEYKHRNIKDAIFNLCCLAYCGVNDKSLIENLNADCEKELALYDDLKKRYAKLYTALEEIVILYDKWLGNEMSEFEFFTLLNEITEKYDLLKEVVL